MKLLDVNRNCEFYKNEILYKIKMFVKQYKLFNIFFFLSTKFSSQITLKVWNNAYYFFFLFDYIIICKSIKTILFHKMILLKNLFSFSTLPNYCFCIKQQDNRQIFLKFAWSNPMIYRFFHMEINNTIIFLPSQWTNYNIVRCRFPSSYFFIAILSLQKL